jgi:prevent-host-death family protein
MAGLRPAWILTKLDQEIGPATLGERWPRKFRMETFNLYEAKTNLSQLIERAAAGEEIIIAKAGRPLARLVPIAKRSGPRPLGMFKGEVTLRDDFDAPLPDGLAAAFRGEEP